MLNLTPLFEYANDACSEFGEHLSVPPLPAAIYMMQRDVINHYRYSARLAISLDEPYLQNSSFGTPYQKWTKFANRNPVPCVMRVSYSHQGKEKLNDEETKTTYP